MTQSPISTARRFVGAVVVATLACGCSSRNTPTSDGSADDPSAALFDPTRIIEVEIEMDAADWDLVRQDKRDFSGMDLACPTGPYPSTYTWKRATVTVDGQRTEEAGIRKKGFVGSVNSIKPSLKIKYDKFVEGQTLFGLERLTLNNNVQDPAQVRQCLSYALFRAAGLPAPRCNFARVSVNGQHVGIYSNTESIKKRFLARNFSQNDGDLYEGTLSDFRESWMATFDPKTTDTDSAMTKVKAVTAALELPDDGLLARLSQLVDVDSFVKFWALNVLAGNADSYFTKGNNFFVYFNADPAASKMVFIPWGTDATFRTNASTKGGEQGVGVQARPILARRLYLLPEGQAKFIAAMRELLSDVWVESKLEAEIDRMKRLLQQDAANEPELGQGKDGKDVGKGQDFASALAELSSFVSGRRDAVQAIVNSPPVWTEPLAEYCSSTPDTSEATGSFSTTYGTLDSPDPFAAGSGAVVATGKEGKVTASKVGAEAGADPKNPSERVMVHVIFDLGDAVLRTSHFSIARAAFVTGTVEVDQTNALMGAVSAASAGKTWIEGTLVGGSVTLTKAGLTDGEAVEGTFTGKWAKGGK